MSLFKTIELRKMDDLMINQLEDIYDAEMRLVDVLPKMAEAAHNPALKRAFTHHLRETEQHVTRLEGIFRELGCEPKRTACDAMKGLIKEGSTIVDAKGDPDVKDAALIAAAQRVEHYEMATYGCLRSYAHRMGKDRLAQTLNQTLQEEGNADKTLTDIAEREITIRAQEV